MTNVIKEKNMQCKSIEWNLMTKTSGSTHVSQPFSLQDRECYLEFHLGAITGFGRNGVSISYLHFKSNGGELPSPVTFTVRVTTAASVTISNQTSESIKGISETIWSCPNNLQNVLLTFYIIIYDASLTGDESIKISSYKDCCFVLDNLSQDFSKLLDEGPYYDVEFICGDQTIKAHKNILCCRSTVFASMLQSDMQEGKTGQVNIKDINSKIFRQFLGCLYTGKLPEITVETAVQLYEAADKYCGEAVKKQCADFLIDNLYTDNACEILVLADLHHDEVFKENIMNYIIRERIPYIGQAWKDFCKENPILANEVYYLFCEKFRSI